MIIKIEPQNIMDLTESEWDTLGVRTIGERTRLRARSRMASTSSMLSDIPNYTLNVNNFQTPLRTLYIYMHYVLNRQIVYYNY